MTVQNCNLHLKGNLLIFSMQVLRKAWPLVKSIDGVFFLHMDIVQHETDTAT